MRQPVGPQDAACRAPRGSREDLKRQLVGPQEAAGRALRGSWEGLGGLGSLGASAPPSLKPIGPSHRMSRTISLWDLLGKQRRKKRESEGKMAQVTADVLSVRSSMKE